MKRVVIAGCGIAGLEAALNLYKMLGNKVEIIGVDKNRFFSFLPYLHRVASLTLKEEKIIVSLKDFFNNLRSEFFREEVVEIKPEENKIVTTKQTIDYDYLIISLGCKTNFYGIPGAEENCFDFRDAEDAVRLSEHIAKMFFYAKKTDSKEKRRQMLRFTVCGAGATGIELVTELKQYIQYLCKKYGIEKSETELVLVEAMPNVLPGLPEELSKKVVGYTENSLKRLGVKLICNSPVVEVGKDFVKLKDEKFLYTNTVVWCGGLKTHTLIKNSGLKTDRRGYLEVNPYLQSSFKEEFLENVYCAGDVLTFIDKKTGKPLMKIGRHAVDQGKTSAKNIYANITGKRMVEYVPRTEATVISLGRSDAIGFYGNRVFKGKIALWLKYWIEDGYLKRYKT